MTVVSRKGIRRIITLICQGRLCDECPIDDECREVLREDGTDDATIDQLEVLFKKICKEK